MDLYLYLYSAMAFYSLIAIKFASHFLSGALKMQDRKMTDKDIAGGGKCSSGI